MVMPDPNRNTGGWFSNWGQWLPDLGWGAEQPTEPQPPMPQFEQQPQQYPPWESPPMNAGGGVPPMPPPPPHGSGTSSPWGGQEVSPEDPYEVVNEYTPGKKYSFLDNPGASDALVAFGAAMLKAPDFNSGLGDAALAVNGVAREYRMPTEQDYAKAKQLGIIARIKSGRTVVPEGAGGGGIEVDQKTSFYDEQGNLYWAATDGTGNPGVWDSNNQKFIAGGVPGLTRATDSSVGAGNRASAKLDSDAEQQLYIEAQSATDNLIQLNNLAAIRPTAGIGLDKATDISRRIVTLTGMSWGDIDPTSISSLQASTRQLGLNWSQKMKGQGQVTEFERQQIVEMLPQALMDPQAFDNLVELLKKTESRKMQMADEWFSDQANLRRQYGSFRGFMLSRVKELEITAPTQGNGPAPRTNSGSTGTRIEWSID
jgi:hypothetical protein